MFDTHTHIASDDQVAYPRRPGGFGSSWWQSGGHGVDSLLAAMDVNGVEWAVVVQAIGVYGHDNRYVLDSVAAHPSRLTAVVGIDMEDDPSATVRAAAATAGVVGVRVFAVGGNDRWVGHDVFGQVLQECAEAGLVAVLTVFDRHLPRLRPFVAAAPAAVALDHCAFPAIDNGRIAADAPLLDWSELANVSLKVSSHLLLELDTQANAPVFVEDLHDRFGADRLLWGSDYPQSADGYGALVALASRAAAGLGAPEQHAFLDGNARQVFAPSGH